MEEKNGKRQFSEVFRWITPVMITIGIFILGGIQSTVKDIDTKLFRHLTNDEIHCPKSVVVTKPEFNIYQEFRQKQMTEMRDNLTERINGIRVSVDRIIELLESRKK